MPDPRPFRNQNARAQKKGSYIPRRYRPNRFGDGQTKPVLSTSRPTGTIHRLTNDTIQTLGWPDKKYSIRDFETALKTNVILSSVCELKALRSSLTLGQYVHPNKAIQDWVRGVFEDMEGSLYDIAGRASIASYYGFWCAEIVWSNREPGHRWEWRCKAIEPLDLHKVKFRGNKYGLKEIEYNAGGEIRRIPLSKDSPFVNKAIVITSGALDIRNEPYGIGLARRALPYVKALDLLMAEWVVAGRNQSQGLLIGKADSAKTVHLNGPDGKPIMQGGKPQVMSAVHQLAQEMEQVDGRGFLVTDLENQIQHQPWQIDANFYSTAIEKIKRFLMLSQIAPALTFEEGMSSSLGTAGIAEQTRLTLDAVIRSINTRLQNAIIENIVRPMLVVNFGITARQGWGSFEVDSEADPSHASTVVNNIISAISSQVISATDTSAVNRVRKMLGLPPQTEKEILAEVQRGIVIENLKYGVGDPRDLTEGSGGMIPQEEEEEEEEGAEEVPAEEPLPEDPEAMEPIEEPEGAASQEQEYPPA